MLAHFKYLIFAISMLYSSLSRGDESSVSSSFEQANQLYDKGDYEGAQTHYIETLNSHQFGDLYFNLGNTSYRLGNKGKAMAYYLAARHHLPRNPDVIANLRFLQEKTSDRIAIESEGLIATIMFWKTWATTKELLFIGAILWFLGFLLLTIQRLRPNLSGTKEGGILCIATSLVFAIFITMNYTFAETWGAVTSPSAKVYSGPGNHNAVVFELHEAAAFKQTKRQQTWFQIELSDGRKGWVSGKDITVAETVTL